MAETIEIHDQVQDWLDVRLDMLARRTEASSTGDYKNLPTTPYAEEAGAAFDPAGGGELADEKSFPAIDDLYKKALDLYRDGDHTGTEQIAMLRQIALVESFKKQLIGRRRRRFMIAQHQAAIELDAERRHLRLANDLLGPGHNRQELFSE